MKTQKINLKYVLGDSPPVLKGKFFCSPACGCGCTKAEFNKAVRGAKLLDKCLTGSAWRIVVYEAAGWHFKAVCNSLTVHGDWLGHKGSVRYICLILGKGSFRQYHDDPNRAVAYALNHCISEFSKAMTLLFDACSLVDHKDVFFSMLTQLSAVEFLRHPNGHQSPERDIRVASKGKSKVRKKGP